MYANGDAMCLGGAQTYGQGKPGEVTRDPGLPASSNWSPTAVFIWRL